MKYCHNCGAEIKEGSLFCGSCGTKLVKEENVVTVQEQPKTVVQPVKVEQQPTVAPVNYSDQTTTTAPVNNDVKTNGLSVAGFVVSIVSFLCCGSFSGIGLILSIIGLVQVNKNGQKGKGLAIAGIIIGAIGVLFLIGISSIASIGDLINELDTTGLTTY